MSFNRTKRHIEERVIVTYDGKGNIISKETRQIYKDEVEDGKKQNDDTPNFAPWQSTYGRKLGILPAPARKVDNYHNLRFS